MSYVSSVLEPDEIVVVRGELHWAAYLPILPLLVIALALALPWMTATMHWSFPIPSQSLPLAPEALAAGGAVVGLLCLLQALGIWIDRLAVEIAVTSRRFIVKRGIVWRTTVEMNLSKVETVEVEQSVLGRILNYGSVEARGTGSGIEAVSFVSDPLRLRSAMTARTGSQMLDAESAARSRAMASSRA